MARPPSPPWRIIPRPLLETILNNHAHHHRVPQPLLLHGPRGSGKSSLLRSRLLPEWNRGPHFTAFVDLNPSPSWTFDSPSPLLDLRSLLEASLETLARSAIEMGAISSRDVFKALAKTHGVSTALRRLAGRDGASESKLWHRAVFDRIGTVRIGAGSEVAVGDDRRRCAVEEVAFVKEAEAALGVAKEVFEMMQEWRKEALREMNRSGRFSRSLVDSATDWPVLLVKLLSGAAEVDFFQPKLVINNIDILRKATATDDSMVPAAMYHDSFIWRLIALGVNERCLPIILATSDG